MLQFELYGEKAHALMTDAAAVEQQCAEPPAPLVRRRQAHLAIASRSFAAALHYEATGVNTLGAVHGCRRDPMLGRSRRCCLGIHLRRSARPLLAACTRRRGRFVRYHLQQQQQQQQQRPLRCPLLLLQQLLLAYRVRRLCHQCTRYLPQQYPRQAGATFPQ